VVPGAGLGGEDARGLAAGGAGAAFGAGAAIGVSIVMMRIGVIGTIGGSGAGSTGFEGGADGVTCGRETSSSGIRSVSLARPRRVVSPTRPSAPRGAGSARDDAGAASGGFSGLGGAISGSSSSMGTSMAPSDGVPLAAFVVADGSGLEDSGRSSLIRPPATALALDHGPDRPGTCRPASRG
jgi:hypothetical protein